MFWPFAKKHPVLKIPPHDAQQSWTVARGTRDGEPLIVRVNQTARALVGQPGLPIKLGFAIPLNRPREGALPDADENQELCAVEDLIANRALEVSVGVHALTLTMGVMKEFVFYVAPGADIAGLHAELSERVTSHEVQCMAVEEPNYVNMSLVNDGKLDPAKPERDSFREIVTW